MNTLDLCYIKRELGADLVSATLTNENVFIKVHIDDSRDGQDLVLRLDFILSQFNLINMCMEKMIVKAFKDKYCMNGVWHE